jgi:chromosome partitioning protein
MACRYDGSDHTDESVANGSVITIAHTKGGAGKTSLTFNLGYALSQCALRVLIIDLDQQTGQSAFLGEHLDGATADIGDVLLGRAELDDALATAVHPGLDVLPADERSMGEAGSQLREGVARWRLLDLFDAARHRWDVVLVDTPGHQSDVVRAALSGSDGVILPMIPEAGPVTELPTILNTVESATAEHGRPEVYGVIKMRIGGNSVYRRIAEDQIRTITDQYEVPLFRNKIPEDAKFGEAHLIGQPVGAYQSTARSAIAYRYVAYELIQRRGWTANVPEMF